MALEYADWIRNNTRIFTDWVNLFLLKGKYTCMEIILKWRSLWIRMQSKRAKLKVNVIFMLTPFKYALFLRSEVKSQDEQERWSKLCLWYCRGQISRGPCEKFSMSSLCEPGLSFYFTGQRSGKGSVCEKGCRCLRDEQPTSDCPISMHSLLKLGHNEVTKKGGHVYITKRSGLL